MRVYTTFAITSEQEINWTDYSFLKKTIHAYIIQSCMFLIDTACSQHPILLQNYNVTASLTSLFG